MPEFFLLVDNRFFFRSRVLGGSPENDQFTGHFQSFFLIFFLISRTNSKTSKENQQFVVNL